MVIDLEQTNELVKPESSRIRKFRGTDLFSGLFNVLTVVVVFIFSRRVYRRFTHTLSEEEKQKMSVWKSGATGLFIIIGLILYYAIPVLVASIDV